MKTKMFMHLAVAATLFSLLITQAGAAEYKLDTSHTEVGFSVKHMVITRVKGAFRDFSGHFVVDEQKGLVSFETEVKAASIDTRINKRDDHLRSPDFFDVATYPKITFTTKSVENSGKNTFIILGDLQIRDVSKPVKLKGELTGEVNDPWGNKRVGIVMKGTINRKDFGLTYNKVLENGGLLIGSDVDVSLEGEGIRKR